jgi:hypothetical protein
VGDGGKKARSPGRARRKPLKPFAQGMPGRSGVPVVTTLVCFFSVARETAGAVDAPGIPCALYFEGGCHQLGRACVAGGRTRVASLFAAHSSRRGLSAAPSGWRSPAPPFPRHPEARAEASLEGRRATARAAHPSRRAKSAHLRMTLRDAAPPLLSPFLSQTLRTRVFATFELDSNTGATVSRNHAAVV